MKKIHIFLLIVILGTFTLLLTSCDTVAVYQKPGLGPPAHAPAYGLRHKAPKTGVIVHVD